MGGSINGGGPKIDGLYVYMFICLWTIPLSQYEGFRLPLCCSEGHFADIEWAQKGHGFSTARSHISESPRFAEEHGSKRLELDPSISLDDLNEL